MTRSALGYLGCLLSVLTMAAPAAFAGPGELDVRFASGGWLDLSEMDLVTSIVPMPDGSAVVAGNKWPGGSNPVDREPEVNVSRISATGARLWSKSVGRGYATSVQRLSTGRILLGFSTYEKGRFGRIVALREDGSFDPGFGHQGQISLTRLQVVSGAGTAPDAVSFDAIRELPDGSLLVSAQVSNDTISTAWDPATQAVVFRLGMDGQLLESPRAADPLLRERIPASTHTVADGRALVLAARGCCSEARGLLLTRSTSGVLAESQASLGTALSLDESAYDPMTRRFYALGRWHTDPVLVAGDADGILDPAFGKDGTGRIAFPMATGEYARLLVDEEAALVSIRYQAYRDFALGVEPRAQIFVERRSASGELDAGIEGSVAVPLANPEGPLRVSSVQLASAGPGYAWLSATVDSAEIRWDATSAEFPSRVRLAKLQLGSDIGQGTLGFQVFHTRLSEQGPAQRVRVVRSGGNTGAIEVRYEVATDSSAGPDDVNPTTGVLRWADGDGSARTIELSVRNDALLEGEEQYIVRLLDPAGSVDIVDVPLTVTIEDDEAVSSISAAAGSRQITAGEAAQFVLRLDRPAPGPVKVTAIVGDGMDPGTGWPLYTGKNNSGWVRKTVVWMAGEQDERSVRLPTNRVQDTAYSVDLHLRLGSVAGLVRHPAPDGSAVGAVVTVLGPPPSSSNTSGSGGAAINPGGPVASDPPEGGGTTGAWALTALSFLLVARLRRRHCVLAAATARHAGEADSVS